MPSLYPTSSDPAADHHDLVEGMQSLYQILIDLDYVQNTDVQVPPHGLPKDPVAVAPLRSAGLEPEPIELIGRLPCFTNSINELQRKASNSRDGVAIAPFSSATSYLLGSGRQDEVRGVGIGLVGDETFLPASAFKLATSSSPEGYNFAYDTTDKTIISWRTDAWGKCHRIPVAQFFDKWLQRLKTLEWLPWHDESGWELELHQADCHKGLGDHHSAISEEVRNVLDLNRIDAEIAGKHLQPTNNLCAQYLQIQKAAHNQYWAKRHIYESSGWPDNFDKERFHREKSKWNARATELGASARSKSEAAPSDSKERRELQEFYKRTAGKHAV